MTKKEMFATIATLLADNTEIVEFCNHEISLLSNRSGSKTPTKTQKENVAIKEQIVNILRTLGKAVTVTELLSTDELGDYTNQKISALLRQLVESGQVVKTIEGKKAMFTIAEGE